MKNNEPAIHKFGLQALKTVAVLVLFFGVSFILNVSAANTIQKVATQGQTANAKADEMLKMIDN